MTRSEELVYDICNENFLSLWSFANPIGKKGKELCDILVVCEPDVIIFSVKEINLDNNSYDQFIIDRWIQRAIEESVKQIYGAERFIRSSETILLSDRKTKIRIPNAKELKIHRVAVSFGRGDKFPLPYGDFNKGFVHVFDEKSFQIILHELDTVKDFINYLIKKEEFATNNSKILMYGEEDLLGYYISNDFSFPDKSGLLILNDIWKGLLKDKRYLDYKNSVKNNMWDRLISILINDFINNHLTTDTTREDLELTLRHMARERGVSRNLLGEQFLDFIGYSDEPKAQARIIKSSENPDLIYVFLLGDFKDREIRYKELQLRSFVARYLDKDCKVVVGIATERYNSKGYSLDFSYLNLPFMDDDAKERAQQMMDELGYFKNAVERKIN